MKFQDILFFAFIFTPLRIIYNFLQRLKWSIDGTGHQIAHAQVNYDRCAQVTKILWRCMPMATGLVEEDNFICWHEKFTFPERILANNASLLTVTKTHALFTEHPPDVDVTHSSTNCMMRLAQFEKAIRIVSIPLKHFHRLAAEIGPPKQNVIFLLNHTRCGSTLVTQMMETDDDVIALSEPQCLSTPIELYCQRSVTRDEAKNLLKSCFYMLCKPLEGKNVSTYCIKQVGYSSGGFELIHELFPHFKYIYLYRDGLPSLKSLFWILRLARNPLFQYVNSLILGGSNVINMYSWVFGDVDRDQEVGWIYDHKYLRNNRFMALAAMVWGNMNRQYVKWRKKGLPICALKYEDILQDPAKISHIIQTYCNIGKMDYESVMSRDVQQGSAFSLRNYDKSKDPCHINDRVKKEIDDVLSRLGMGSCSEGQACILPGTLGRDVMG